LCRLGKFRKFVRDARLTGGTEHVVPQRVLLEVGLPDEEDVEDRYVLSQAETAAAR
jgi:hypothetical protein